MRTKEIGDDIYLRMYLLVASTRAPWPSAGAVVGLVGALLSVLFGVSLWSISRFIAPVEDAPTLNVLSNILTALTFPMLALGAYCLDRLERKFPKTQLPSTEPRF